MKILFTGGMTGGHFYPIIAIIQALRDLEIKENTLEAELYYVADKEFDERLLFDNRVTFKQIVSGKRRAYVSILNFTDIFKTLKAIIQATWYMYKVYPDVVFGKGGGASFPSLVAARILRIPVMIHESDSVPGKANLYGGKFAKSIALSYPEAGEYFPEEKTVLTGNPIRKEIIQPIAEGARQYLKLEENTPVILVLGGSQGAQAINDAVVEALPVLLNDFQVIHQLGETNVPFVEGLLEGVIGTHPQKHRYKYFGYLNDIAMKMSAGASDLVISRAGSTIFEIAIWGKPSIVIPLDPTISTHQSNNAYHYARTGSALVMEQENLSPNLLVSEIKRLFNNPQTLADMAVKAKQFSTPDSAEKIARELLEIGREHTK